MSESRDYEFDNEMMNRHQKLAADGEFREKHYQEAVCRVLDNCGVEYESEYKFKTFGSQERRDSKIGRRCDIYIPKTDTAIELKKEPSLRGVGQCVFYRRFCSEAILLVDGDPINGNTLNPDVKAATEIVPNVTYATAIPNVIDDVIGVSTDGFSKFIEAGKYGEFGWGEFISSVSPFNGVKNIHTKHEATDD